MYKSIKKRATLHFTTRELKNAVPGVEVIPMSELNTLTKFDCDTKVRLWNIVFRQVHNAHFKIVLLYHKLILDQETSNSLFADKSSALIQTLKRVMICNIFLSIANSISPKDKDTFILLLILQLLECHWCLFLSITHWLVIINNSNMTCHLHRTCLSYKNQIG